MFAFQYPAIRIIPIKTCFDIHLVSSSTDKLFQMAEYASVFPWSLSHISVCN